MDSVVGNLYNDLMCLCEIRGELSAEDNARVEERILSLQLQIEKLEKSGLWLINKNKSRLGVDSCFQKKYNSYINW